MIILRFKEVRVLFNRKNFIFSFILGLIFPLIIFFGLIFPFTIFDETIFEPVGMRTKVFTLLIFITYFLLVLIVHFKLLKKLEGELRFVISLGYVVLTGIIGVLFIWILGVINSNGIFMGLTL
jgi:hypothetical protein